MTRRTKETLSGITKWPLISSVATKSVTLKRSAAQEEMQQHQQLHSGLPRMHLLLLLLLLHCRRILTHVRGAGMASAPSGWVESRRLHLRKSSRR
ncbi:MAG: hypothetical protein QGI09_06930 [Dehalococcoidia bacterium]|nr:hypothetical protein [Dehalococcoidia bacterium]